MKDKKAISDVVATVLIILITVAAVAIVWAAIIPMINNKLPTAGGCTDAQTDLSIVTTTGGYTCVNATGVKVQYARGAGNYNLVGVNVIVSSGGTTVNDMSAVTCSVPNANEEKVCYLTNNSPIDMGATKVTIVPLVKVGTATQTCAASQEATVKPC